MQAMTASKTALITSWMRALHARTDAHRIVDDPWGDRLVPDTAREAVWRGVVAAATADQGGLKGASIEAIVKDWLRRSTVYANVLLRSRYAEDALHAAVTRGCTQYVLVGAGFDSYALRTPAHAGCVRVFEVDQRATQSLKRRRLAECGLCVPDSVRFLAADLSVESLDAVLQRSSFDAAKPAFFSCLGVTMYLTREANSQLLRSVSRVAAADSELVFTYVDQGAFESAQIPDSDLGKAVASMGEPFLSGFRPEELEHELHPFGFTLVEDLDDYQLVRRYDPSGMNQLRTSAHSRIAHSKVHHSERVGAA
jgi:methyltransferase (TIGR00027 family)